MVSQAEKNQEYEKKGYLNSDYRMFYLEENEEKEFQNHYHDFDKIIIFLKGHVCYTIEGKSYDLLENDIVLIRHGDVHKVQISKDTPYERIIMYLSPVYLDNFNKNDFSLGNCFLMAKEKYSNVIRFSNINNNTLIKIAMQIKESLESKQNEESEELLRETLLIQFMIFLERSIKSGFGSYVDTDHCNRKIVEIIQFINHNLTEELNIDFLANYFYLTKYHMMRQFKKETGYTIGNYITNKRLMYAKELIKRGEPITKVCFECGFKEHSTFNRAYKQLYGVTPVKSREEDI